MSGPYSDPKLESLSVFLGVVYEKYSEFIESAPLVEHIDTIVTTGDAEYPGTALEVCDQDGRELFHVVVDLTGENISCS